MTDRNDRAESSKRHDDSRIIDKMDDAPSQGLSSGHNISRDIGSRDELRQEVGDGEGVTRVGDSDKPEQANLPRYNQKT